jgi:hypothetical protein
VYEPFESSSKRPAGAAPRPADGGGAVGEKKKKEEKIKRSL